MEFLYGARVSKHWSGSCVFMIAELIGMFFQNAPGDKCIVMKVRKSLTHCFLLVLKRLPDGFSFTAGKWFGVVLFFTRSRCINKAAGFFVCVVSAYFAVDLQQTLVLKTTRPHSAALYTTVCQSLYFWVIAVHYSK